MILYVDDDAQSRGALSHLLRKNGYEVTEAGDAAEALNLIENGAFGLLIVDVVLPGLNGIRLAEMVRLKWPKIPIIIVSAYLSDLPGKTILNGSGEFIPKPININDLLAAVKRFIPSLALILSIIA
jgi:DNA-binding response OmpR family regulator